MTGWRVAGCYPDGDLAFGRPGEDCPPETLPDFFDRVAGSVQVFTLNPPFGLYVNDDMVAAPARHSLRSPCGESAPG